MNVVHDHVCIRIYVNENDHWHNRPLSIALLHLLAEQGCAGATLFKGAAGFGSHGQIHIATPIDVTPAVPVVLEWVDRLERVDRVLPLLLPMIQGGLITRFPVELVRTAPHALGHLPHRRTVASVMTRDIVSITPETSLARVVAELIDHERRFVPVIDAERHIVGIITNEDLVECGGLRVRVHLIPAIGLDTMRQEIKALERDPRRAVDVMSRPVVTIHANDSVRAASTTMISNHLKRLPVVDAQGRLTGMISRADLLQLVAHQQAPGEATKSEIPGFAIRVGDIAVRSVPVVPPDADLPNVLDALISTRLSRVVVADELRRPLGIISDAVLLSCLEKGSHESVLEALRRRLPFGHPPPARSRPPADTFAEDLMVAPIETVTEDATVAETTTSLLKNHCKVLPVVNAGGVLVGMLDRADLLRALYGGDAAGNSTDLSSGR